MQWLRYTLVGLLVGSMGVAGMGQVSPLSGRWAGKLTQNEGGFRADYDFEITIVVEGDQVRGRSLVSVEQIFAEMDLIGFVADGVLHLQEQRIVRAQKPRELEWCYKSAQLRLVRRADADYLEGPWQGVAATGGCIPGWIVLKRSPPRA